MPDLLRQGSAMLHRVRRESVSHTVVYRRGNGEDLVEVELLATVSVTRTERIDVNGSSSTRHRDFCFETAAMLIAGEPFEPRAGDVVIETNGEIPEKFELVAIPGEGCFRREGLQNESTRVHTIKVGVDE